MNFGNVCGRLLDGRAKLAVVGLGYVGLPIAYEFAKRVPVIGYDVDKDKIKAYQHGMDTEGKCDGPLSSVSIAYTSSPAMLKAASFIIVTVQTPVDKDQKPDLTPLREASRTVGENLSAGAVVVFESTVYPGVTQDICVPIIEKASGLTCGVDWKVGYSPERINPGDHVHTLTTIQKVVAGQDQETTWVIQSVYDLIIDAGTFSVSDIRTAEAVKVVENSQRDINIAFMNEVAILCDKLNVDTAEVLAGMNTKWNALGFRPGLVGGHCISVDPYYLTFAAEKAGYDCPVIRAGRSVNNHMGAYVADAAIREMEAAGIAPQTAAVVILGFTFKENWPDIRNSRIMDIIRRLRERGIAPVVTDPIADPTAVEAEYDVTLTRADALPPADCMIVAVGHRAYRAMTMAQIKALFRPDVPDAQKVLVDVKSIYGTAELEASGLRYWRL